jgi:hypothetical protein
MCLGDDGPGPSRARKEEHVPSATAHRTSSCGSHPSDFHAVFNSKSSRKTMQARLSFPNPQMPSVQPGRRARARKQRRFSLPGSLRLYGLFVASVSVIIRCSTMRLDPWDHSVRVVMDWNLYLAVASIGLRFTTSLSCGRVPAARGRGIRKACPSRGESCPERYGMPSACWTQRIGTAVYRMRSLARDRTVESSGPVRFRGYDLVGSTGVADTSASCSIVAMAYQGALGGFDGKSRGESARP